MFLYSYTVTVTVTVTSHGYKLRLPAYVFASSMVEVMCIEENGSGARGYYYGGQ